MEMFEKFKILKNEFKTTKVNNLLHIMQRMQFCTVEDRKIITHNPHWCPPVSDQERSKLRETRNRLQSVSLLCALECLSPVDGG